MCRVPPSALAELLVLTLLLQGLGLCRPLEQGPSWGCRAR